MAVRRCTSISMPSSARVRSSTVWSSVVETAVTGRLGGHLAAVVDGPADGGDHVVGVVDLEDGHRVLLDVDHPRGARGVPGVVGGRVQPADDAATQVLQRVGLVAGLAGRLGGDRGGGAGWCRTSGCSSRVGRLAVEPMTRGWCERACTPLAAFLPRRWQVVGSATAARAASSAAALPGQALQLLVEYDGRAGVLEGPRGSPRAAYPHARKWSTTPRWSTVP